MDTDDFVSVYGYSVVQIPLLPPGSELAGNRE